MNSLEIIASVGFQETVDAALALSRTHDDREVGFSSWVSTEGLMINQPVVGEASKISDHGLGESVHEAGTGFNVGEGGLLIAAFHTHPLLEDDRRVMLSPSVGDVIKLALEANQNLKLAEMYHASNWWNPLGVIGSGRRPELSVFQVESEVVDDFNFELEDFDEECRLAVWGLFKQYYPKHALNQSGTIFETFGPMGDWPIDEGGSIRWLPRFLSKEKRYAEYLKRIHVRWALGDLAVVTSDSLGFEAMPIPRDDPEIEQYDDEFSILDELDIEH